MDNQANNKRISIGVVVIVLLIITGVVLWFMNFFQQEFVYVNINYNDSKLDIVTNPTDLLVKKVGRWTDVQATANNNSQGICRVQIDSPSLKTSFDLGPGLQYGLILPKGEQVTLTFCGVKKDLFFRK